MDIKIKKLNAKILKEIEDIEQLACDMRDMVYREDYDLEIKSNSIKLWIKILERDLNKIKSLQK